MGSINNTNSSAVNQTVINFNQTGTRAAELEHIREQLDVLVERLKRNAAVSHTEVLQALTAVKDLKTELAQPTPKLQTVEQTLSILGNLSSLSGWVAQIRPMLANLF